jgi:stage IV sporulation protein FB
LELKRFRFRIHPLFLLTGVLSALFGQLLLFLMATIAAVMHECAHAFAARRYGYSLDTVVLMPYGAVVSGDISGIGKKQELAVLLAGPLANGLCAVFFIALWWLFPETYAYTDFAAWISLSLFAVNLLPAYPLDGGRILRLLLAPLGEIKARLICRIVTFLIAACVLGYFVYTCFSAPAFTALAFALMLVFGTFGGGRYGRMAFSREKSLRRGVEERRVVISSECPIKDALRYLSEEKYLILVLYENGEYLGELSEEEYLAAVEKEDYAKPLGECLPRF